MPLCTINKVYASNTQNAMDLWAACISAAGWELYDFFSSPKVFQAVQ